MAIKDITLGQYFPGESAIHRLDPRTKLFAVLVYIVSLFVADSFAGLALCAAALAAVIAISRIPFRYIASSLRFILFLIIVTTVVNIFSYPGEPIFRIGPLKATAEGLERSAFVAARLVMLILGTSLLSLTTKPIALTDGLEASMKPFKKIGLPVHELAMMMSIALRFIPTLLEETDKIMKAQKARGADFDSGGLIKKAKSLIPLLVPLFVSAFRIASDLAMAMEARCYHGGEGRTRMNAMKYTKLDAVAAV
ncbi:MAG: energy-coupling factor transporter transmembrane protein EcfT, partial [Firmicutes bacterium]|nr:energy-coupling factor transporter transmembrane protein EcfT [Bacillota bacterium]